jgi:hypothetical protein
VGCFILECVIEASNTYVCSFRIFSVFSITFNSRCLCSACQLCECCSVAFSYFFALMSILINEAEQLHLHAWYRSSRTYTPVITSARTYTPVITSARTYTPVITSTRTYTPMITTARTYTPVITSVGTYTPVISGAGTYIPEMRVLCF